MRNSAAKLRVICLGIGLLSSGPALAECIYNGVGFSQGAIIGIGDVRFECVENVWNSDGNIEPANCFYASEIYTKGAKIRIADRTVITCDHNGKWDLDGQPRVPASDQ